LTAPERTRVLYVINDLARAGAETQLVELVRRLDRVAFEPSVVLLKARNDFAEELTAAGVPVAALGRRGWWDVGVVWRLAREVQRFRPHVVHSWLFLANLVSALAVRRGSGRHLIVSQRCSYEAMAGLGWRRVARWSHRRADCVIVNSRAALEEEAAAGHPRSCLVYIPNGVGEPAPPAANRSALGLPAGPLVVCVGQLAHIKGHHVLVEAWPAVGKAVPGAQLVLVGAGPQRGALEERARNLGVSGTIVFAGFRARAGPFMAFADVFVQPSLSEGMPNAVLEAMAASRPVVASSVGGIPELIVDGESGILVPPSDPHALAAAVARLLVDRALAVRLAAAAAKRARELFSFDRALAETEALYRSLTARAGGLAIARTADASRTGPIGTP